MRFLNPGNGAKKFSYNYLQTAALSSTSMSLSTTSYHCIPDGLEIPFHTEMIFSKSRRFLFPSGIYHRRSCDLWSLRYVAIFLSATTDLVTVFIKHRNFNDSSKSSSHEFSPFPNLPHEHRDFRIPGVMRRKIFEVILPAVEPSSTSGNDYIL